MKYPDFVIVGAMKCGTTALWRNLDQHPHVAMGKNSEDPKATSTEIRFWNDGGPHHTWRKGINWYRKRFSGHCAGEKCANYIESPTAMRRMYSYMPDAKIVVCVRDPVDRMLSEFWMHHQKPEKIAKFAKFAKDAGARARSRYMEQLKRSVLQVYPRDQVYIVVQERMSSDVLGETNKLLSWLGLSPIDLPVIEVGFVERDDRIEGLRVWETGHKVDMSSEIREVLNEHFAPHNEKFFKWLGSDIPEWCHG